jgi:hypothetical protein
LVRRGFVVRTQKGRVIGSYHKNEWNIYNT